MVFIQYCDSHLLVINFNVLVNIGNGKDYGKLSGRIIDSDMHDVGRFLNRLLGLPPEIQNRSLVCRLKLFCSLKLL